MKPSFLIATLIILSNVAIAGMNEMFISNTTQEVKQKKQEMINPYTEERSFWGKAYDRKYPYASAQEKAHKIDSWEPHKVTEHINQFGNDFDSPAAIKSMLNSGSKKLESLAYKALGMQDTTNNNFGGVPPAELQQILHQQLQQIQR